VKAFAIDLDICNGCYCCQVACKDEHCGNDWTPYAKPQPETGQFWVGLKELIRGQVPKVKITYLVQMCQHCDEAFCEKSCKVPGAIYRRDDGMVIIDPEKCNGCKLCVESCPHGAVFFNDNLNIAQKCTGCAHLRDNDPDTWANTTRCADACPTGALRFGEEEDLADFIKDAELLNPQDGVKTRVFYKGLPKKFVGGTLYDPVEEEVIIGANCTLKDNESGEAFTTTTDHYGDFWFRDLKDNRMFTLTLEKNGNTKIVENVSTEIDLSLGDIPLEI
jgi:tetrathionate reductase subunit B